MVTAIAAPASNFQNLSVTPVKISMENIKAYLNTL